MREKRIKYLIQTAMFSAMIAVLAQIAIPMPNAVPITLQTFAIALAGFFAGPIQATISVFIYILVGSIGIPVFSNLHGGFNYLFGATGGFIFGFIPMSIMCGLASLLKISSLKNISDIFKIISALIISFLGLASCHIVGAWHYANFTSKQIPDVLPLVSYPFVVKDVLSVIFAYFLSFSIKHRLNIK